MIDTAYILAADIPLHQGKEMQLPELEPDHTVREFRSVLVFQAAAASVKRSWPKLVGADCLP